MEIAIPFQTEDMARRRSSRKCAVFQQGWDLGQIPAYCPFAVEEQFKDAAEDRREEEEALKRGEERRKRIARGETIPGWGSYHED